MCRSMLVGTSPTLQSILSTFIILFYMINRSMIPESETGNFEIFKDCLSTTIIQRLAPSGKRSKSKRVKGRKNEIKPVVKDDEGNDAAELGEFIEVCVTIRHYLCN